MESNQHQGGGGNICVFELYLTLRNESDHFSRKEVSTIIDYFAHSWTSYKLNHTACICLCPADFTHLSGF